ncbi:hypothetical protein [Kingella potus]|uniref:hypothetical protein n=1 Tax=Kingella potus TaxID=265175 RepID=UPI001FD55312|nr:hypothetical protein [Kingella potus]UOP00684.1 hypothetical protein LVJ84_12915 [Kingella potus]
MASDWQAESVSASLKPAAPVFRLPFRRHQRQPENVIPPRTLSPLPPAGEG